MVLCWDTNVTAVARRPRFMKQALLVSFVGKLTGGVVLERALLQGSGVNCPVMQDFQLLVLSTA